MTTFDERERAFENKFQHDEELLFRIRAKRDKLVGLWAAGLLGLADDEAAAYAARIVDQDFGTAGPHNIRDRILSDLQAQNVDISDHRVDKEMENLLAVARDKVMNG
jgi:hypothetical protein